MPYEQSAPPCRFCGTQFAESVTYCPRCGLQRGAAQPGLTVSPPSVTQYQLPPTYTAPSYGPPTYPPRPYVPSPGPLNPAPNSAYPAYQTYPAYPGYPVPLPMASAPRPRTGMWLALALVVIVVIVGAAVAATKFTGNRSAAATVSVPDGPGVVFRSSKGHFAARFPEVPDQKVIPGSLGSTSFTLVVASDPVSHTAAECEVFSPALGQNELAAELASAIEGTAAGAGGTLVDSMSTTFQGHAAHQGDFTAAGLSFTAIVFAVGDDRIYELLAPAGPAFTDLQASFVPTN